MHIIIGAANMCSSHAYTACSSMNVLMVAVNYMQAALKARQPDSLPALIPAAKPSPQESALVTDLQTKLKSLQVALYASL